MKYSLFILICFLLVSCNASKTIWSTELTSKDGQWLLSASTIDTAGPGIGYLGTSVYLKRIDSRNKPQEILDISNESVSPEGNTRLSMSWVKPTEIQIIYFGKAEITYQVTKFAGFDIAVKHEDKYAAQPGVQADVHEKP